MESPVPQTDTPSVNDLVARLDAMIGPDTLEGLQCAVAEKINMAYADRGIKAPEIICGRGEFTEPGNLVIFVSVGLPLPDALGGGQITADMRVQGVTIVNYGEETEAISVYARTPGSDNWVPMTLGDVANSIREKYDNSFV